MPVRALTGTLAVSFLAAAPLLAIRELPVAAGFRLVAAAVIALKGRTTLEASHLRSASVTDYEMHLGSDGVQRRIHISPGTQGTVTLRLDKAAAAASLRLIGNEAGPQGGELRYEINGIRKRLLAVWVDEALHLVIEAAVFVFAEVSPWPGKEVANDPGRAISPVAGVVAQVLVKPGDAVTAGQMLLSVEAMKMEMWLSAQASGIIKAVHAVVGEQVQSQVLLIELDLLDIEARES